MRFGNNLFPTFVVTLLAQAKQKSTTWFIDGNNLIGHKGTPKSAAKIQEKLELILGAEGIVLVLDGKEAEETTTTTGTTGAFRKVVTAKSSSADDYILQEIERLCDSNPRPKIQVVTADRELRRKALDSRPVVKGVVNPVVFWKRYLPRLTGTKLPQKRH